jgi:hypothetical protein
MAAGAQDDLSSGVTVKAVPVVSLSINEIFFEKIF